MSKKDKLAALRTSLTFQLTSMADLDWDHFLVTASLARGEAIKQNKNMTMSADDRKIQGEREGISGIDDLFRSKE